MLGAVILSGKNTLVLELPTGTMDLQTKLNSIGIQQTADQIRLADDDGRSIRVKLYARLPEEAHLLPLLTSDKSLADANSSMFLLNASPPEVQSQLRFGLIADRYGSLDDFLQEARSKLLVAPASSGAPEEDALSSALELFESDPNHRLVVSAVQGGKSDVFLLPMSDRDYAAVCVRFDDFHDTAFQIEACRYNDHWRSLFDTVLQKEGLHGLYYVTDHVATEAEATSFIPNASSGVLTVWGLEDDAYSVTETHTADGYTLLRDSIEIVITAEESDTLCELCGAALLTASATVNGNAVTMLENNGSVNACVPFTVVNTKGPDLPKTGDAGTWMYGVIGAALAACSGAVLFLALRKRKTEQ